MQNLESLSDNETWPLEKSPQPDASPPATLTHVRMASRFDAGRATLSLPPGTVQLAGFPAVRVERNALGAVHAQLGVDWANYEAQAVPGIALYAPPAADDSAVPAEEREVLQQNLVESLGLAGLAPAERLRRIENHLAGFRYSTYRERPVPRRGDRAGRFPHAHARRALRIFRHAPTTLAARARSRRAPARATRPGFAGGRIQPPLEGAWVIRTRHAHAWSRAWVDGRWVDTWTPRRPAGALEEANEAPYWQGLADLFRYAGFRWSQRGEFKAGNSWYAVLVLLALYLGWSVLRGRRIVREQKAAPARASKRYPGEDSEFYAVEKSLPPREASETQSAWLQRIDAGITLKKVARVREALRLHQRYRFDPAGLSR